MTRKILKEYPNIFGLSTSLIKDKTDELKQLGFKDKDISRILIKSTRILGYDKSTYKDKLNELSKIYNLTKEETIDVFTKSPNIFSLSIEDISSSYNNFLSFDYTKEEIKKIIQSFPQILNLSNTKINRRLNLIKRVGFLKLVLNNPKDIMISTELLYSRIEYLKSINYELNNSNYRTLFCGNERFRSTFKITKEELLEAYPYIEGELTDGKGL